MTVAGKCSTIISRSGLYANIGAFTRALPTMNKVGIVEYAIAYDEPYPLKIILCGARNLLDIPSTDHNLIPPFMICEV